MSESYLQRAFAQRIGGEKFGKDTKIYKFEKIKRAKREAMAKNPGVSLIDMGVGEPDDQRMGHVDLVVNHKSRKLIGLVIHTPERDYFVTPQLFERLAPVLTAENGLEKTEASDAGHT